MGVRLIREVLDHAPADLTPAERLLLVVLAENANDTTREAWPGMDVLAHRTGLTPDGVSKVLFRLARRGLEVRVPLCTDRRGRLVFAVRGRRTTYRLPGFHEREVPTRDSKATAPSVEVVRSDVRTTIETRKARPRSDHSNLNGRTAVFERSDHGRPLVGPPSDPSPQEPSRNPQQHTSARTLEQIIRAHTDATVAEAAAVVALIQGEKRPLSLGGLLRTLATGGELPDWVARVRDRQNRGDVRAALAELRSKPPCEHGDPGGDRPHPTSGEPLCPLCRAQQRLSK